jgi:hypothetical protein
MISLYKNSVNPLVGALWLCLFETALAATAPASSTAAASLSPNSVESLITELSSLSTLAAFRLFLQRSQELITGLVYVSILVLPRTTANGDGNLKNNVNSNKKGGIEGSNSNNGNNPSNKAKKGGSSSSGGGFAAAATGNFHGVLLGTTADGSDLEEWQRVNSALEQQIYNNGLDWSNSCVYELQNREISNKENGDSGGGGDSGGVLILAPVPEYPLAATAAFYAATKSKEGIICNEYDAVK